MEIYIFMEESNMPSRDDWQEAIEEAGFPVTLSPTLDLRKASGFRAVVYSGKDTGFELYVKSADSYLEDYQQIASEVGIRDKCIVFRWGSDYPAKSAAICCAAALTRASDGVFYDPETDKVFVASEVYVGTREYIDDE